MITALISASLFYFIPICFGLIIYKIWQSSRDYFKPVLIPVIGLVIQFLVITFISIMYKYRFIVTDLTLFRNVILCIYLLVIGAGCYVTFNYRSAIIAQLIKQKWTLLLCLIITLVVYAIWRFDSPYPSPLNWDIYEHLTFAHKLFDGYFSLKLSAVSDTFTVNSYLPIYHVLLSAPFFIFHKLNYLGYYWFLELFQLFIILYITSVLVSFLSENLLYKYLAILISGTIFVSFVAYTPLFHLPQTLTSIIFALVLIYLFNAIRNYQSVSIVLILLLLATLVLSHFLVGTISVLVIGMLYIYQLLNRANIKQQTTKQKAMIFKYSLNIAIFVLSIVLLLVILFSKQLTYNPFGTPESIHFSFHANEVLQYMQNWFGYSYLLVIPAILLAVITKNIINKLISIISLFLLIVVFYPFPYTLKILVIAQYLIIVQVAFVIAELINALSHKFMRFIAVVIWTVLMFMIFYFNQKTVFKEWIKYENIYTHVSPAEYEAAEYIRDNYEFSEDLLLVSEPATQYIFEAISGINTQGGMYANLDTRKYVDSTYPSQNPASIKSSLFSIRDNLIITEPKKVLFVVSGRFFEWQEWDTEDKSVDHVNVWKSYDLNITNNKYLDMLATSGQFKQVYRNKAVAVYEVNR